MFSFFKKKIDKSLPEAVTQEALKAKDPMDWTLTEESTEWQAERYCSICFKHIGHYEVMSNICNGCGSYSHIYSRRAKRKIFNGLKWVWQYKYGNSESEYSIEDKEL